MSWKTGGNLLRRTDFRLTFLYSAIFFFSALLICGFLYLRMKSQLVKEVDRFLLDECGELSEGLSKSRQDTETFRDFENLVRGRTHYPVYFKVLDGEGNAVYVSDLFKRFTYDTDRSVLRNPINRREIRQNIYPAEKRSPLRLVSIPYSRGGVHVYSLQVATHLKYVRKNLIHFRQNVFVTLPIVLLLGSLGGWFLARKSLSPIGYITAKTRHITSENLSERLVPRETGDELDDLIWTINGMVARLEDSFRRMSEFTADASHELKTPICAMRGEAEVLLSKVRSMEDYQEGLVHFIEQFDHMNRTVNDLILLSRFDSAQMGLQMAPLRMDSLIREICDLFQVLAEQKKVRLEIEPLPEVTLMGDRVRLQQLFTNLMDNAIKYTDAGTIRVSVERNPDVIQIKIRDTGIGIPREEQGKIFKRFYRVDKSRSRETGGAGLGLSIAEWVARAHHGTVEVESEERRGSTFTVSLPAPSA